MSKLMVVNEKDIENIIQATLNLLSNCGRINYDPHGVIKSIRELVKEEWFLKGIFEQFIKRQPVHGSIMWSERPDLVERFGE